MQEVELTPEHKVLILACDGIWDVMTDQEAVDICSSEKDAKSMANKLLQHALKKNTRDNVTVVVIQL